MCGICGVIRFDGGTVEQPALEAGCVRMKHRGPDHTGIWIDKTCCVGLGAVRLAVLDPSTSANQPMCRGDGRYHLVFNGEIYNHAALRQQLESCGELFQTNGDTEVVLAACVKWGIEALNKFNGMWSLAFYDLRNRSGFLARDRFGIKPTLYSTEDGCLTFASELQSLVVLTETNRTVDQRAVAEHLTFGYIAHPRTIYYGVRRLAPGHYLTFEPAGAKQAARYYDPVLERRKDINPYSAETRTELRRLIGQAVISRKTAHVPVGAFLSGGLDSSIIVFHLAKASGRAIKTFSVGYADRPSYDETAYARTVARALATDHQEILLTQPEVLAALPGIMDRLGEPIGDSSIIPTALVSKFARDAVTVALSGDAGDELFGGYWRYQGHASLAAYRRLPRWLRHFCIEPALSQTSKGRVSMIGNRARQLQKLLRSSESTPLARHLAWSSILSPEVGDLLTDQQVLCNLQQDRLSIAERYTAAMADEGLNQILGFDLQYQLPADMLQKVDLASMMYSLEVRVPLLDASVVAFALGLPTCVKIDRGLPKRLLVDAYRGHLPDEVLDRPKQGFEVPIGEYFRGPLREMYHDVVTEKTLQAFPMISSTVAQRVFEDHAAGRADHSDLLFALLSLCWWRSRQNG